MNPLGSEAQSRAALPMLNRFDAPAHWRAIDFISDLHLTAAMPATYAACMDYLHSSCADAVFILGDLFELWVGDDARAGAFERRCAEVLVEASSGKHLSFMVGNRDFLLGQEMLAACGLTALPDPTVLAAFGTRVLLTHGDMLCLDDAPYQAFRTLVRSAAWQRPFLARPLPERLAIAAEIRAHSESRRQFEGASDADIDKPTAIAWLRDVQASCLIHGHTHRPGDQFLAPGLPRHVLSDWDVDSPIGARAEVLRWTRDGIVRLAPARAHLMHG